MILLFIIMINLVLCSDAPETGLAHFADLYNLALNYCSPQVSISTVHCLYLHKCSSRLHLLIHYLTTWLQVTKQMDQATPIFVDSVYQFLLATLVLSYA